MIIGVLFCQCSLTSLRNELDLSYIIFSLVIFMGFIDGDEGDHDCGAGDGVDDDCCIWRR